MDTKNLSDKDLLVAVKIAAGVPVNGWGASWNPLTDSAHCQELMASQRVRINWKDDSVFAWKDGNEAVQENIAESWRASEAMRRAVVRAVIENNIRALAAK